MCYVEFVKFCLFFRHASLVNNKSKKDKHSSWIAVIGVQLQNYQNMSLQTLAQLVQRNPGLVYLVICSVLPKPKISHLNHFPINSTGAPLARVWDCFCGSVLNFTLSAKMHVFWEYWAYDWMYETWIQSWHETAYGCFWLVSHIDENINGQNVHWEIYQMNE